MSFLDLIDEAKQMFLDRSKEEADLIYAIAKLDAEERSALILAYQSIHYHEKESKAQEAKVKDQCKTSSHPANAI